MRICNDRGRLLETERPNFCGNHPVISVARSPFEALEILVPLLIITTCYTVILDILLIYYAVL
jgi:hypothetical protein